VAERLAPGAGVLDPEVAFDLLGATIRSAAPGGDPSIVLLSDGPANAAWYEHNEIGRRLGIPVVQPRDVMVRGGRLHAWLGEGRTRPIDVVYRRTDEDRLRDRAGRATWLADLLLAPVRRGTLAVVNPFGAGLADDKLVHAYVEEMVRFYLGEEPLLRSVRTMDLSDDAVRAEALGALGDLVVKPRSGYGGAGVVVCRQAGDDDVAALAREIAAAPREWIAQETVELCTHPTVCDGRLEPRHVDLRPFVFGGGDVAPAALTRVAFEAGQMIVNSSRGGGAKDTWLAA
jgi:carboxylate-amine ligase